MKGEKGFEEGGSVSSTDDRTLQGLFAPDGQLPWQWMETLTDSSFQVLEVIRKSADKVVLGQKTDRVFIFSIQYIDPIIPPTNKQCRSLCDQINLIMQAYVFT